MQSARADEKIIKRTTKEPNGHIMNPQCLRISRPHVDAYNELETNLDRHAPSFFIDKQRSTK